MNKFKSFIKAFTFALFGLFGLSIISCEEVKDNPSIESSDPTSEPVHTHKWDEGTITKDPTCLNEGEITYSCIDCDEVKFETIAALGHTEVIDEEVKPTCESTGLTEGKHCDRCGKTLVYQQTMPVIAHKEVIDKAVTPTCTENGLTEGKHCEVCKQVLVYQQVILATGHNEIVDKAVSATCTETGLSEGSHCDICDEILVKQEVVDALGHDYGEWYVTNEPECESEGLKRKDCEVCDHYEKETIEALGHNEVVEQGKEATCTTTGLTEGKHCDRCGEVLVIQEVVDALGHDYDSVVTSPTCEEQGYTKHTCNKCDDSYVDNYVDALGHDYKSKVSNPTCEEQGYTTHTCNKCDDSYVDNYVDALGHKYVDSVCKECGHKQEYSVGLEYKLSNDGTSYSVLGIGTVTATNIIIPSTFNELPVTNINNLAFFDNDEITSVIIPESVTNIGTGAFAYCDSLRIVTCYNKDIKISIHSFYECTSLANAPNNILDRKNLEKKYLDDLLTALDTRKTVLIRNMDNLISKYKLDLDNNNFFEQAESLIDLSNIDIWLKDTIKNGGDLNDISIQLDSNLCMLECDIVEYETIIQNHFDNKEILESIVLSSNNYLSTQEIDALLRIIDIISVRDLSYSEMTKVNKLLESVSVIIEGEKIEKKFIKSFKTKYSNLAELTTEEFNSIILEIESINLQNKYIDIFFSDLSDANQITDKELIIKLNNLDYSIIDKQLKSHNNLLNDLENKYEVIIKVRKYTTNTINTTSSKIKSLGFTILSNDYDYEFRILGKFILIPTSFTFNEVLKEAGITSMDSNYNLTEEGYLGNLNDICNEAASLYDSYVYSRNIIDTIYQLVNETGFPSSKAKTYANKVEALGTPYDLYNAIKEAYDKGKTYETVLNEYTSSVNTILKEAQNAHDTAKHNYYINYNFKKDKEELKLSFTSSYCNLTTDEINALLRMVDVVEMVNMSKLTTEEMEIEYNRVNSILNNITLLAQCENNEAKLINKEMDFLNSYGNQFTVKELQGIINELNSIDLTYNYIDSIFETASKITTMTDADLLAQVSALNSDKISGDRKAQEAAIKDFSDKYAIVYKVRDYTNSVVDQVIAEFAGWNLLVNDYDYEFRLATGGKDFMVVPTNKTASEVAYEAGDVDINGEYTLTTNGFVGKINAIYNEAHSLWFAFDSSLNDIIRIRELDKADDSGLSSTHVKNYVSQIYQLGDIYSLYNDIKNATSYKTVLDTYKANVDAIVEKAVAHYNARKKAYMYTEQNEVLWLHTINQFANVFSDSNFALFVQEGNELLKETKNNLLNNSITIQEVDAKQSEFDNKFANLINKYDELSKESDANLLAANKAKAIKYLDDVIAAAREYDVDDVIEFKLFQLRGHYKNLIDNAVYSNDIIVIIDYTYCTDADGLFDKTTDIRYMVSDLTAKGEFIKDLKYVILSISNSDPVLSYTGSVSGQGQYNSEDGVLVALVTLKSWNNITFTYTDVHGFSFILTYDNTEFVGDVNEKGQYGAPWNYGNDEYYLYTDNANTAMEGIFLIDYCYTSRTYKFTYNPVTKTMNVDFVE